MEQIRIAAADDHHKEDDQVSMIVEDHDSGSDHESVSDHESGSDRGEFKQNGEDSESDHSEYRLNNEFSDSDCEADSDSDSGDGQFRVFTRNGIAARVEESSQQYENIRKSFAVGMGAAAGVTEVVALHKNLLTEIDTHRARFVIFKGFSDVVGKKCGGNANIRFAWYSGSRDEIARILRHGFGSWNADEFGRIQLIPAKCALDGAKALKVDDNGLRHMLLCRVILGKMEELPSGSEQYKPSSNEFDSGVDCVVNPRRYFVWSACMHTHICPFYVVSFKCPASLEGFVTSSTTSTIRAASVPGAVVQGNARAKRSAFGHVSLAALVAALTRFVTPREMKIIVGLFQDFRAKKFDVMELKRKVKLIAGDKLVSAMKLAAASAKGSGTLGGLKLENGSVRDIYLPGLLPVLAEYLPARKMDMLNKSLGDFRAKKINRAELAKCVRLIVDNDNVLLAAINSYRIKKQLPQDKQQSVV